MPLNKNRRWVNDAPQHRFTWKGLLRALIDWDRAIKHGHDHETSARYVIHSCERAWHSGRSGLDLNKGAWMTSNRIDSSLKRLEGLISATLKQSIKVSDLQHWKERLLDWAKTSNTKQAKTFRKVCINYSTIVGLKNENEFHALVSDYSLSNNLCNFEDWQYFSRGRDLFVFGKFDLAKTLDSLGRSCCLLPHDIMHEAYGSAWFYDIWRQGHSQAAPTHWGLDQQRYFQLALAYVKRYIGYWRQHPGVARLDEVATAWTSYGEEAINLIQRNLRPEAFLNRVTEMREAYMAGQVWDPRNNCVNEPIDPMEPYPTTLPAAEIDGYKIASIKNYDELLYVAAQLGNCATNYHGFIKNGDCHLVRFDKDGEVIALGELRPNTSFGANSLVWHQLEEARWKSPRREIREASLAYLAML
jgi:hypothetical protein